MRAGPPVEGWARRVIADRKVAPIAVSPPDRQSAAVRPISPAAPSEGHVGGHAAAGARRKAAASSSARPARSRAVPDPGRTSRGDRAGAGDPVGRHACEAPAAGRDKAGDRPRAARPAVAAGNPWLDTGAARPEARLVLLVAGVLVVSLLGTAVGLWGRWQATRTTKRVQVATRRRVFEHAARLPLHRVYQLKVGRGGEPSPRGRRRRWRAGLQHALQPLAGRRPARGRAGVLAWVDWRLLARLALSAAGSVRVGAALEPMAPAALPRRPQAAAGDRRHGHRGVRRDAGRPRLRPPAARGRAVRRRERLPDPPGAFRLVVVAARRGGLGPAAADRLGGTAALRRAPGPRRPALAGRPDDVPGLPGDAPGALGRDRDERHPAPEQSGGLRPRPRPAGRAA